MLVFQMIYNKFVYLNWNEAHKEVMYMLRVGKKVQFL